MYFWELNSALSYTFEGPVLDLTYMVAYVRQDWFNKIVFR
jgi:hypothetical protein